MSGSTEEASRVRMGGQPDPTPEEIAAMCQEIRAERSEELMERMASKHYRPYQIPVCRLNLNAD